MSLRFPSAKIAVFAVCHDTPSPAAAQETVRWSTTIAVSAHPIPPREIFSLGAAAFTHRSDIYLSRRAPEATSSRGRWLLGHELAHSVQQSGGSGGSGSDAVSRAPAELIQCYFVVARANHGALGVTAPSTTTFPGHETDDEHPDFLTEDRTAPHRVIKAAIPDLKVSDDGKMAVEHLTVSAPTREAEAFFAHTSVITAANKKLKSAKSGIVLHQEAANALTVPKIGSKSRTQLAKVVAREITYGSFGPFPTTTLGPSGPALHSKEQCIEMAEVVMGSAAKKPKLHRESGLGFNALFHDLGVTHYLAAYIEARLKGLNESRSKAAAKSALAELRAPDQSTLRHPWNAPQYKLTFADETHMKEFHTALGRLNIAALRDKSGVFDAPGGPAAAEKLESGKYTSLITVKSEDKIAGHDTYLADKGLDVHYESIERIADFKAVRPLDPDEVNALIVQARLTSLETLTSNPGYFAEANRILKMNEFTDPSVAQAFQIFHKGDGSSEAYPYHFAGVVAKSGSDVVTFENYARETHQLGGGGDQRMYFQMYGSERSVTIAGGKADRVADPDEAAERERGSFHGRWKGYFRDAQTITVTG